MKNSGETKLFRLDELFDIYRGKRLTKADMIPGDLNYIGAIDNSNGVRERIDADKLFDGNCITVNYNGSVGEAFYQDMPFWASDDVNVLFLKERSLTKALAMYFITLIKANKYRFGYGRKWTFERMSKTQIAVPVTSFGKPDYQYMEEYINALYPEPITTGVRNDSRNVSTCLGNSYKLGDLFCFKKGKRLTKADMVPGELNYIGAIDSNNGVREKIDAEKLFDGNCITVNYNGSVGEAFYQSEPFWASDDVNVLYAKDWEMNKFNALFIVTVIKANRYRFNYGRKWTLDKMKETIIKLPSNNSGSPDFEFMENYIKSLPYGDRI